MVSRDARRGERERAAAEAIAAQERQEKERLDKAHKRAEALIEFMLYNLSGKLGTAGQLQLFGEVSDKALEYFEGFEAAEQTPSLKWNKAVALQGRGVIRLDAGKVTEALAAQQASLAIFRELAQAPDAAEANRIAVAGQCSYVAYVRAILGDTPAALELFREAVELTEKSLKVPEPEPYLMGNLAYFRDRIGDVLKLTASSMRR